MESAEGSVAFEVVRGYGQGGCEVEHSEGAIDLKVAAGCVI